MKKFIEYLHKASDNLADLMDIPREDWDSIIHSVSDEELQEMIDVWEKENKEKCYN